MKKIKILLVSVFAILIFLNGNVFGQSKYPRVEIKDTQIRQLFSREIGQRYSINVFLPKSYYKNSLKKYPVIFILDAEYNFGLVSYITRRLIKGREIPEVILVGIAYDTDYETYYKLRRRDYTSVTSGKDPFSGGAEKFARFIKEDLTDFISGNYRIKKEDRTIVGHSYGGHFAYYCLLNKPGFFNRFLIVSPSIWYGNKVLLKNEKEYHQKRKNINAVVYTAVGGDERGGEGKFGFDKNNHSMLSYWALMAERIKSRHYSDLKMKDEILIHESHKSVFAPAFTNGMKYLFKNHKGQLLNYEGQKMAMK